MAKFFPKLWLSGLLVAFWMLGLGKQQGESRPDTGTAASLPVLGPAKLRCPSLLTLAIFRTSISTTMTLLQHAAADQHILAAIKDLGL
jgi:hypothetical protein